MFEWEWVIAGVVLVGLAFFLYLYHLRPPKPDTNQRKLMMRWPLYRLVDWYLKLSTVGIFLASLYSSSPWLLKLYPIHPATLGVGLTMTAAGLLLFVAAMRHLAHEYTPLYQAHMPTKIVMTGPYRWIRHPIYTSNLLQITGLLIASGSLWLALNLVILFGFYLPTILREEGYLKDEFAEYREYTLRTGRFFPRWTGMRSTATVRPE